MSKKIIAAIFALSLTLSLSTTSSATPTATKDRADCCSSNTSYPFINVPLTQNVAQEALQPFKSGWYIAGGLSFPNFLQTESNTIQTLPSSGNNPDAFMPATLRASFAYNVSVGYQKKTYWHWLPAYRVGLAYQNTPDINVTGTVRQRSYATVKNVVGTLENQMFLVESSVDFRGIQFKNHQALFPYGEFGLGFSRSNLTGYQIIHPTPDTFIPDNSYYSVAWRVGAGLSYHIPTPHHELTVSLGYRYSAMGQAQSGTVYSPRVSTEESGPLSQSISANEFLFNIRWVI